MQLATMPHIGRRDEVPGTHELIFHPWPYIAVYRVTKDSIRILRIRHASQQWP
jgi:toxin ParE1/3/4